MKAVGFQVVKYLPVMGGTIQKTKIKKIDLEKFYVRYVKYNHVENTEVKGNDKYLKWLATKVVLNGIKRRS